MKLKTVIFLIYTIAIFNYCSAGEIIYSEKSVLSSVELIRFQKIRKIYPEFNFTKDVIRYYKIENGTKNKIPILVEMVFQKKGDLFFDKFKSYSVCYEPDSRIIKYTFDAGTAERGEGTIIFSEEKIMDIQWLCGVSGCDIYISENNKIIYPK